MIFNEVNPRVPPAFKHQDDAREAAQGDKPGDAKSGFGWFMEQGTGKSKVLIDQAVHLYNGYFIKGLLIFAPKGAYLNWIKNELPAHCRTRYAVMGWSADMGKAATDELNEFVVAQVGYLKVLVMNTEALSTARGVAMAEKFLKANRSLICIDESTSIKSPTATRTKAAMKLGQLAPYRRIMSGTPITQSPLDIYTQFRFLDPKLLGYTSFFAFRARYARLVRVHLGPRSFQKVDGYQNLDELQRKISEHSFRCLKKDCLDLPEKIYTTRYVELSPAQRKAYTDLKEMAMFQIGQGIVTAPHALTLIMRMHQVLCGHTKLDDGTVVDIEPSAENPRLKVLAEVIEEAQGKVIIWCNYQRDVELICGMLAESHGIDSVVHYYGKTGGEDRAESLERFKSDEKCRFFVGTAATGGVGLTLVSASTVVYYSQSYNLEKRLQSEDRAHRIGQTKDVLYVDLTAAKTVDEKILKALREKHDLSKSVLGDLQKIVAES